MRILGDKRAYPTVSLFTGLLLVGLGILNIVSSVRVYSLFGVFLGIALCLGAPGLVVVPFKDRAEAAGKRWLYLLALAPAWLALPMRLAVGVALWLNVGSTVSAAQMIQHPFLYNNRVVSTSGKVLLGGNKCTLLVPADDGQSSGEEVWVSSANKWCFAPVTIRAHANVTGTFIVLRSMNHTPIHYVLGHATVTVTDTSDAQPGT